MQQLASLCASVLSGGDIVFFKASLGAGKTTFVRSMLTAYGYQGIVKSPTYGIVECYDVGQPFSIAHFDLYRLTDAESLFNIGFDDYMSSDYISLIEWPEHCLSALPAACLEVEIHILDSSLRNVFFDVKSSALRKKLDSLLTFD